MRGSVAEAPAEPTGAGGAFALTPSKLRAWGLLSALSVFDQGLTSAAGFLANLLLARWMSPDVYGAFAVAFAGFLFVSGFHNVLLLEPLSVFGPASHSKRLPAYFRAQIWVHLILAGALSVMVLLGTAAVAGATPKSPLIGAMIGGGLALPFLLLLWLARRMCYVARRSSIAVEGSGVYFVLIMVGLFVLRHFAILDPFTVFLLMGCGSIAGAALILFRLRVYEAGPVVSAISWGATLRENWTYGRWLVGSTVLFSLSSQTQTFLAAGILGLGAAGILRAMQIPSLAMVQLITASGLLVLPSFSYDFGQGRIEQLRHKAKLASFGLALAALCFAGALALFAGPVEHILFGGKYAAYASLMPVLALVPAASGISMGYSMALRASQRPHFDLISNMFAAPVAIVSAYFFTRWWGLRGAAASMAISFAVMSIVTILFFRYLGKPNPSA